MEPTDTNLRAWEEAHKRIRRSSARGSRTLPKPVRERLPDIGGRHLLHLACGAGRETAALMSLGALVTAVDSSEETIVAARKRLPDAALVTASPEALPVELPPSADVDLRPKGESPQTPRRRPSGHEDDDTEKP